MDDREALALLAGQLEAWRRRSYAELVACIADDVVAGELVGASGARYTFEIDVRWDAAPGGLVRVGGLIDDGGWRSLCPVCEDFLVAPDGTFVGEGDGG